MVLAMLTFLLEVLKAYAIYWIMVDVEINK